MRHRAHGSFFFESDSAMAAMNSSCKCFVLLALWLALSVRGDVSVTWTHGSVPAADTVKLGVTSTTALPSARKCEAATPLSLQSLNISCMQTLRQRARLEEECSHLVGRIRMETRSLV
jgi:hypothetical protein